MRASDIPAKINIPFASSAGAGFINAIPDPTQIGITAGAASFTDGFPPVTFVPVGAGGVPPWGRDFNGLLNQITAWDRWSGCAGGRPLFDATFSAKVGGYPQGALIGAVNGVTVGSPQGGEHLWLSNIDNNTTNPDTVFSATNWTPIPAVISSTVTYTVGGTGAQFSDINAAYLYLSQFYVTNFGQINLQYGSGLFNYSSSVVLSHPNNDRISIKGASMLAALPLTDASYAVTGNSASARANDLVTNLAMLRTKFATELHFVNNTGMQIVGKALGTLDSLLVSGDGTTAVGLSALFTGQTQGTNGLAFVGFGGDGITMNNSSLQCNVGAGLPLVCLGNGGGGLSMFGSFLNSSHVLAFGNRNAGLFLGFSGIQNDGNMFSDGNGDAGVSANAGFGTLAVGSVGAVRRNATWGILLQNGSRLTISNPMDLGAGGNANGSGPAFANDMSMLNVDSSTNTTGSSPAVGVVGNNNSLITTT